MNAQSASLFKKSGYCLTAGVLLSGAALLIGNGGGVIWFPPILVFAFVGIGMFGGVFFPIAWHFTTLNNRLRSEWTFDVLDNGIRLILCFIWSAFAFKKFFGLQFLVPDHIAALPMNEQSGEWLTWFYFGYSKAFVYAAGFLELSGAVLLLFRRTRLAGALLLFPMAVALLGINLFYGMNAGALTQSVIAAWGVIFVLLGFRKEFIALLKTDAHKISAKQSSAARNAFKLLNVALALLFTWYLRESLALHP